MEDLIDMLKELKKDIAKDKKDDIKEVKETIKMVADILNEDDCVIIATRGKSLVYGRGGEILALYYTMTKNLLKNMPLEPLTDAFVRAVSSKGDDPKITDKDKINEILEVIKEII